MWFFSPNFCMLLTEIKQNLFVFRRRNVHCFRLQILLWKLNIFQGTVEWDRGESWPCSSWEGLRASTSLCGRCSIQLLQEIPGAAQPSSTQGPTLMGKSAHSRQVSPQKCEFSVPPRPGAFSSKHCSAPLMINSDFSCQLFSTPTLRCWGFGGFCLFQPGEAKGEGKGTRKPSEERQSRQREHHPSGRRWKDVVMWQYGCVGVSHQTQWHLVLSHTKYQGGWAELKAAVALRALLSALLPCPMN